MRGRQNSRKASSPLGPTISETEKNHEDGGWMDGWMDGWTSIQNKTMDILRNFVVKSVVMGKTPQKQNGIGLRVDPPPPISIPKAL